MHKLRLLISSVLVLVVISIFSETITFDENAGNELLNCNSKDLKQIRLEFSLSGFQLQEIGEQGEVNHQITCSDLQEIDIRDQDQLPDFSCLIAIPDKGETEVIVVSSETEYFQDIEVIPDGNTSPDIVTISEPAIFRDLRVISVTIKPFHYSKNTRELAVTKNLEVVLSTIGINGINQKQVSGKRSSAFEPIYESLITNYRDLTRNEFQQPSYLFIYPDVSTIQNDLQPLLDWKHKKGFEVTAASTTETGSSLAEIKGYLQNAYDTWENRPEFVCLIGDGTGTYSIPATFLEGGEGDQYYALLEGDDILADVIIGRLSIESPFHLQTIIGKIFNYERYPYMGETDWYTNALLAADPSYSSPATVNTCLRR